MMIFILQGKKKRKISWKMQNGFWAVLSIIDAVSSYLRDLPLCLCI